MKSKEIKLLRGYYSILQSLKLFLRASWLSLLILAIVLILLTQMGQGGTLVIDLLESPFNVALLICLTVSLSLVISHYPSYLEKNYIENSQIAKGLSTHLRWKMSIRFLCVGLISYEDTNPNPKLPEIRRFDFLKRIQGLILQWAVIYILFRTYYVHVNPQSDSAYVNILFFALAIGIYSTIYWLRNHKKAVRLFKILLPLFFWISVALAILAVIASATCGWSPFAFYSLLVFYTSNLITYSLFRNLRMSMRGIVKAWPLNLFAKNENFLMTMSFFGWVSLFIFFLSQYCIFLFNPIIIILAMLYSLYGLVIHPLKHKMYYAYSLRNGLSRDICIIPRFIFLFIVPISLVLFVLLTVISINTGNELHTLKPVKENNFITEKVFKKRLYEQLRGNSDSTIYFIASYGGGLTANVWNSFLLEKLSNIDGKGKNILRSTVAMSGVSGGAMGQGMHTAIYKNYGRPDQILLRQKKLDSIAESNFLSLDISWMFGYDFIREWFAGWKNFKTDRAKRSMYEYAKRIGDRQMEQLSYREYWAQLFNTEYYPMLITNTTSTHATRGVSSSVKWDDFSKVFPGADDVLWSSKKGYSLSYSDALSTSNRFPFLSPAAKITDHGHYVDGGYFENSGMLSLYDLYVHLSKDSVWQKEFSNHTVVFIQIMNSKGNQIHEMIKDKKDVLVETKESGEISSVLNTITSIDALPRYMNAFIKNQSNQQNLKYIPITLPYFINREDIQSYLNAKEINGNSDSLINQNNLRVKNIIGKDPWESAQPPLARLLSKPAINYMRNVIEEGTLLDSLRSNKNNKK